ncbi:MAG: Rdx family protein [Myxococcota bacterium]|nr:Rdx family protein [Myxococcota bacterium]
MPQASSLEAAIQQEFGADAQVELIRGDDGIFDVCVEGDRIYSKHATGRFPENDEVIASLRSR